MVVGPDRPARRTAAGVLRAIGVAAAERLVSAPGEQPPADKMERPDNRYVPVGDQRFPHVLTTYRLTEHHTAGGMSRYVSHLAELQPEFFAEISPELARRDRRDARRLGHGRVAARRDRSARARDHPHAIAARGRPPVHQVGLPYHWGTRGLVTGDFANDLIAMSEEPNVRIMETKGLVCHIRRGAPAVGSRRPRLSRVTHAR